MTDDPDKNPRAREPLYKKGDLVTVMNEIRCQMEWSTRAWIGLGEGRVLILKDDVKGLTTYFTYNEGYFKFYDRKGGSQEVHIEEITEIGGF